MNIKIIIIISCIISIVIIISIIISSSSSETRLAQNTLNYLLHKPYITLT